MSTFPKARRFFCWTADRQAIYRTWRFCGHLQQTYWFSPERIQEAECQPNDFDIREFGQLSGDYEQLMAEAKRLIESMTLAQLLG